MHRPHYSHGILSVAACVLALAFAGHCKPVSPRTRLLINNDWNFTRNDPPDSAVPSFGVAKPWILAVGNDFIKDPNKRAKRTDSCDRRIGRFGAGPNNGCSKIEKQRQIFLETIL